MDANRMVAAETWISVWSSTLRQREIVSAPMLCSTRDCLEIGGQAAHATDGHRSLAGRSFCPNLQPSVAL